MNHFRFALRMLRRNRTLTTVAVCSLALGIGANTTMFSVVNSVLLRPLPFKDPKRLVMVETTGDFGDAMSPGDLRDIRDHAQCFSEVAAYAPATMNLSGDSGAERINTARVSANLSDLLGVPPLIGRPLLSSDDQPGAERAVLLSYGLWQRRFGGDRSILGRPLKLDGSNYIAIGVMPAMFEFPEKSAAWVPLAFSASDLNDYNSYFLRIVARLKPDIIASQVEGQLQTLALQARSQYPDFRKTWRFRPVPLHEYLIGNSRKLLLILLGAVGFVLLIACANVANLLLAHSIRRQREMAVRQALGAGTRSLALQLLTESLVLAGIGGLAGLLLAILGANLMNVLLPPNLLRLGPVELDIRVLCFTTAISLLAGLSFGLAPALQVVRISLNDNLKQGARAANPSVGTVRFRTLFIVSELTLAVILLTGAGLLLKSFLILQNVALGFQPAQVLTARIELSENKYAKAAHIWDFERALLQKIQTLPGVKSAAVISRLPLSGGNSGYGIDIEGRETPPQNKGKAMQGAGFRSVTPDYFRTMGIPHLAGRQLTERDDEHAQPVAVINAQMAKRFWPGENPVGRRFKPTILGGAWTEIVGVVGDVRHDSLDKPPDPEIFVPFAQSPASQLNLTILTGQNPLGIASGVRAVVNSLDPDQAVFNLRSMQQWVSASVGEPRFRTWLIGAFAIIAMALTAIGVYGVMSYSVAQRTREIGVRMALGAQYRDMMGTVLKSGLRITLLGLAVGLSGALVLTRVLKSLLYQVSPADPTTFVSAAIVLMILALLACWSPAHRAATVNPVEALRNE
jgi:putative ABC transport system permease protein